MQATNAYSHASLARIQAQRSYPRGALLSGAEGNGSIRFTIDRVGHLLDAAIVTSTGRKALDRASLALVRRAEPFPAIPPGLPDELAITMPIRFLIVRPEQRVAAR
jgi:protein TonB